MISENLSKHRNRGLSRGPTLLLVAVALVALVAMGAGCGSDSDTNTDGGTSAEVKDLTLQLSWFVDESAVGEVIARDKGFFEEEGLKVEIVPGGPTNNGVAPVAAGKADIGIASDSPTVMLASSEGIPVKAFGAGLQQGPQAYVSLPETPLSTPQDVRGLVVGVAPTGNSQLEVFLAANDLNRDELGGTRSISFELTPLLQKKVDIAATWLTDIGQLSELPDGYHALSFWDAGVKMYANVYFSNEKFLEEDPETAEAFLRAATKGWLYARENPTEAAELFLQSYPDVEGTSDVAVFQEQMEAVFPLMFTETSEADGFGAMDPAVWGRQIELWDETGQLPGDVPTVEEVMTEQILDDTADDRSVR